MGNIATNVLKTLETSSSIGMFARDTGGCLLARLGLARTKDEAKEVAFTETTESAIFYFSAPAIAKGCGKLFSKIYNTGEDLLSTPIKDLKGIDKEELKKIKLGKTGQIMTTFGLVLPFIFGIAPFRNLLTRKNSGKEKFTELAGLEKKQNRAENTDGKIEDFIKKTAVVSGGALAVSAGILALMKNKNVWEKTEPVVDKALKYLEFEKSGGLKTAHYGALIYPASIAGYFAASRDKYERKENARRFSITVPLLFFGEKLIQNPIYKCADKIFKTDIFNGGNVKSYKDISKLTKNEQAKSLKAKNLAYGSTFLINTVLIAGAVALLNRVQTKKEYEREHKLNNLLSFKDFQDKIGRVQHA